MAKLHFKYGAMNSGKTDALIKTAFNYEERGLTVLVIKPGVDTKGKNKVVARGGHERRVDILAGETLDLELEVAKTSNVACVLVDEAQFLTDRQISQLFNLAKNHDVSLICYGLRADFRNQLFPGSKRLSKLLTISKSCRPCVFVVLKLNLIPEKLMTSTFLTVINLR